MHVYKRTLSTPSLCAAALVALLFCGHIYAQSTTSTALPDSPDTSFSSSARPDQTSPQDTPHQDGQTKRILGIVPNFRAVNADQKLPPQTTKEKFITASQDSWDYSAILVPAALAGYGQITNDTPEFGQGARGYGRYFWHSFVDQTIENYSVEFIVPAIRHEDTRYYTMGHGGFWKRTEYSLSRSFITRNDRGEKTFNSGEIVGAGIASGISNLYYPSRERTFGNTGKKWGQSVGIDAATFMFKEFWPDINHHLFHQTN